MKKQKTKLTGIIIFDPVLSFTPSLKEFSIKDFLKNWPVFWLATFSQNMRFHYAWIGLILISCEFDERDACLIRKGNLWTNILFLWIKTESQIHLNQIYYINDSFNNEKQLEKVISQGELKIKIIKFKSLNKFNENWVNSIGKLKSWIRKNLLSDKKI